MHVEGAQAPSKFENMAVWEKSDDVVSLEKKKSSKNCSVDAMRH